MKRNHLLRALCIVFKAAPMSAIFILLANIIFGVLPVTLAMISGKFIDTAITVAGNPNPFSSLLLVFSMFILLNLLLLSVDTLNEIMKNKLLLALKTQVDIQVLEKYASLEYHYLEDTESLDIINRATGQPNEKILEIFYEFCHLVRMILSIINIFIVIFALLWWVALVSVVLAIPLAVLASKSANNNFNLEREVQKQKRQCDMLESILVDREGNNERFLFGYSKALQDEYLDINKSIWKKQFAMKKKWFVRMKVSSCLYSLIAIVIALFLLRPTIDGTISLGIFVSLFSVSITLVNILGWEITDTVDSLTKNHEFLCDFLKFLNMNESPQSLDRLPLPEMEFHSLDFENVSFKYPNTDRYVISDLSFHIDSSLHYSFVGENGSGKTTVIKLLLGLYDEYHGRILVNGIDIRMIEPLVLRSLFSPIFQDFSMYALTLRENIVLGYNERINKVIKIEEYLNLAHIVDQLPKGLDTPIGKLEDEGYDLSQGQWQRIVLARTLVSPAPILILDEPTASLDPISEGELYQNMHQLAGKRTVLFISHRLGATKLADNIFVFEKGQIVEAGTHEELQKLNKKYATMYNAQREWYV